MRVSLSSSGTAACMMHQCAVLLKDKTVICNVFCTSQHAVVKYLIDSDGDFPCLTKRTHVIDMVHNTMADMVNADCAHNRWLDVLGPIILVLFDVYSRLFYEQKILYLSMTTDDHFAVFRVSVIKVCSK